MLFDTPQTTDLFSRYMVEGFDERDVISVSTLFLPFFTTGRTLFSDDKNDVDIDIIKGNNKYAKLRLRGADSINIGPNNHTRSEQYTTVSRQYPLMEDFGAITASQLSFRQFNENPYMDATKQGRMRMLARRELMEIVRRFVRGFNMLAKSSIIDGQQPAIFGTTSSDLIYDFYRDPTLTFTPSIAWDQANATIMADFDTVCTRTYRLGKQKPDAFFAASDVINAMISDTVFSGQANNRRFNFVGIGSSNMMGDNPVSSMPRKYQKFVDAGWMYRGWIQTPAGFEIHLFSTSDFVQEDNNDYTDLMTSGTGFVCYSQARCDRYFGPDEKLPLIPQKEQMFQELFGMSLRSIEMPMNIKNREALVRPDMFHFDANINSNYTALSLCCQSAPIFVPVHTDAFCKLTGLTT